MKIMDLKIFMVPQWYGDGSLGISTKVKRGEKTEFFCHDTFKRDSDGEAVWYSTNSEIDVNDGVFSLLGDKFAVDYFLMEMIQKFAQKYMDDKIKS